MLKKSFTTVYLSVNKWRTVKSAKLRSLVSGKYALKLQAADRIGNGQARVSKASLRVR